MIRQNNFTADWPFSILVCEIEIKVVHWVIIGIYIAQLDSLKSLHFDPIVNIHKDVHCIHEYMEPCIIQDSDAC